MNRRDLFKFGAGAAAVAATAKIAAEEKPVTKFLTSTPPHGYKGSCTSFMVYAPSMCTVTAFRKPYK